MIDFLSATKYKCKDSLFLGHCKRVSTYDSGEVKYILEGCEGLKIWHNPQADWMKVEGSLPYFLQGHNFTFSTKALVEAVDEIDALLGGIGLWGALVNKFEFGTIVSVEGKPKEYISRHSALPGSRLKKVLNEKYAGRFAMWKKPGVDLKIYDAGANILLKQGLVRREVIEGAGWNPEGNYLKCEIRYNKPEALNLGRGVIVEKMQNQSFLNMLKGELMEEYHLLAPARALVPAKDKKDLSTLDIVVRTLAEVGGLSLDEAKTRIYHTINLAGCLSKSDKDSRKVQ
ncbi:MAG: hypothetical protein IJJ59_02460, partial [Pseudobutyrivibrio sp.]|uniref:hypothetical protein n=1 Tax=Pseudobutyrivibrio sp. TaxID=2014367 RepID=UPI0025E45BEA